MHVDDNVAGNYHTCEVKCIEQLANCLHYWKIPIDSACEQPECRHIGGRRDISSAFMDISSLSASVPTSTSAPTESPAPQLEQRPSLHTALTRIMSNMDSDEGTINEEEGEEECEKAKKTAAVPCGSPNTSNSVFWLEVITAAVPHANTSVISPAA